MRSTRSAGAGLERAARRGLRLAALASGGLLCCGPLACAAPWYPEPPIPEPYETPTLRIARHERTQPASWTAAGLGPHGGSVSTVLFSPDGRLLITAERDKPVLVWSVTERRLLRSLPHGDGIRGLAHHPRRSALVASGDDGLWQWDLATGKSQPLAGQRSLNSSCMALSADGERALTGTAGGHLFVWHVSSGARQIELRGVHSGWVNAVAYNGSRPLFASAGADGLVRIWSTADGSQVAVVDTERDQARDIAWSPDGSRLAMALGDTNQPALWTWHADLGKVDHTHGLNYAWPDAVAWAPDSEHVAVARGAQVEIRNLVSGRMATTFTGGERDVSAVAWSAAGAVVAYGSDDGWVRLAPLGGPDL